MTVNDSTMRVFIVHLRGTRQYRRNCISTGNPSPPMMIAALIVREITGSVT